MTALAAILIVLVSAACAAAASQALRNSAQFEARRRHHETGSAFFLQLGVLFSVLLAFVFSEVWGEYNTAAQAINGECAALHGATILASTLPKPQAQAIERAILAYTESVAQTEFPAMANRHASALARQKLQEMLQTTGRLAMSNPGDQTRTESILSLLTEAHTQRETRIFQVTQALPDALWLVLTIYALILIACVVLAGVESALGQAVFAAAFTGCIVMVLVVVRLLDYPFEGALALPNKDFLKTSKEISMLMET
jgi:uncharacterized membrane protein YkvI